MGYHGLVYPRMVYMCCNGLGKTVVDGMHKHVLVVSKRLFSHCTMGSKRIVNKAQYTYKGISVVESMVEAVDR